MQRRIIQLIAIVAIPILIVVIMLNLPVGGTRVFTLLEYKGVAPGCSFDVAHYRNGYHMGPCGFSRPMNWIYTVECSGAGEHFRFDQVRIDSSLGFGSLKPVAGEVVVERKTKRVIISLRVAHGTEAVEFIGNGKFQIQEGP